MDWLIVAFIAAGAFVWGEVMGFRNGVIVGRAEERVLQRLGTLTKPWERP